MLDGPVHWRACEQKTVMVPGQQHLQLRPVAEQHQFQGRDREKNALERKHEILDASFVWLATNPSVVLSATAEDLLATLAAKSRPLWVGIWLCKHLKTLKPAKMQLSGMSGMQP